MSPEKGKPLVSASLPRGSGLVLPQPGRQGRGLGLRPRSTEVQLREFLRGHGRRFRAIEMAGGMVFGGN